MAEQVVVSIMIKNEETSIVPTLKPFIDDGYLNIFVYDTGSDDNTVEVVTNYLKSVTTPRFKYVVKEEPFVNFCISRNKMLEHSKTLFSECRFTISLDAEWYVVNASKLFDYVKTITIPEESYCVMIHGGGGMEYSQHRLFSHSGNAKYFSVVHEYVVTTGKSTVPDVYFNWLPNEKGAAKTHTRWYTDLSKLLKDYHETKDPRSCFYLAQTYASFEDNINAIRYYKERSTMTHGFNEEQYMALYRLGNIYNSMNEWDNAHKYYLEAYKLRKERVEPLIMIAKHYPEAHVKYMYAKQACITPYPVNDNLFIDKNLYDYDRWDQLAIGAYHMGYYQEGYDALLKAKAIHPDLEHILSNEQYFLQKLFPEKATLVTKRVNMFNLILYSPSKEYELMYRIHSAYLNKKKIDHLFYCFRNQENEYEVVDDILYIKGEESFMPGILEKTLKALKFYNMNLKEKYDYVVRSNISTIINFDKLEQATTVAPLDFGGPLFYTSANVNPEAGLTEEKHIIYGKYGFVSGICMVFSNAAIEFTLTFENQILSYKLQDDLAISIPYQTVKHNLVYRKINGLVEWNVEKFNKDAIAYRNRSDDRTKDVVNMVKQTKALVLEQNLKIEILYNKAGKEVGDFNEHVPILKKYSEECSSILELGIHRLVSTWAILKGIKENGKYTAVGKWEISMLNRNDLDNVCKAKGVTTKILIKNEMTIPLIEFEDVDLIFVDALHTYCHVLWELNTYSFLSSKYIILHDTEAPWGNADDTEYKGDYSEYPESYDKNKKGVLPAIVDFLNDHPEWKMKERLLNNHGLVVLERAYSILPDIKKDPELSVASAI